MTEADYMEKLHSNGIANSREIQLVCSICGTTNETLDKILYVRTGFRNWEQYLNSMPPIEGQDGSIDCINSWDDDDDIDDFEY